MPTPEREEIENLLRKNVWGQVCTCGGGGTEWASEGDTCAVCEGSGIFKWEYSLAIEKIEGLIATASASEYERGKREGAKEALGEILESSCVYTYPHSIYGKGKMVNAVPCSFIKDKITELEGK